MLSLVIPAYNEARRLPASLAACVEHLRCRGMAAEIIVADDGSTDGSAAAFGRAAEELADTGVAMHYLPLPHRGKGAAVRAGILHASGDPVAFLDADLSIPVGILDLFVAAIESGSDVAIASRYVAGSRVRRPFVRRVMGTGYRAFVRAVVPTGVRDTQCGGKAYTAEAARYLFARQRLDGFAFDAEVLYLARLASYRVTEIPFTLAQGDETSIDLLRDAPRMLGDLVRIRANAALRRYS
jgi:glycosyltransferase involved in cell wall biosynthesis